METKPFIAIACGGTGGHLFPGLAVAEQLRLRDTRVALLISPKEVDQQAVKGAPDLEIFTLPAVGLQNRNYLAFGRSFWRSFLVARKLFRQRRPHAVLAMGGFTSAPPVLAAKLAGARTFIHESNTIPGRANRSLAPLVDEVYVGFREALTRINCRRIMFTGTPVRPLFLLPAKPETAESISGKIAACRLALGLKEDRPVVLVVGGSQGASGLNKMILAALPRLISKNWQWLHLCGAQDLEDVISTYSKLGLTAVVKSFLAEMDLALGAATACVSRAGASSLAEIAARRLPSLLVPFPAAADNHQFYNASAYERSGAARLLDQQNGTPDIVAATLTELMENQVARSGIQEALVSWQAPTAARLIADRILENINERSGSRTISGRHRGQGVSGPINALP